MVPCRQKRFLAVLLLALVDQDGAAIPTAVWHAGATVGHHEKVWTKITNASAGYSVECMALGSLDLTEPSVEFPGSCESRAALLGSDTFELLGNLSRCDFKRCGAYKDIQFTTQHGGKSTYSLLVGGWTQVLRTADGFGIGCNYAGSFYPSSGEPFPAVCQWQAVLRGADAFDARPDGSACYFKTCGSFADIQFSDLYGGYDSYTLLGGDFVQITVSASGVGTDCSYLGSASLNLTDSPEANSTSPPLACVSKGLTMGADTFDFRPGVCYFKRCGSIREMLFTDRFGPYMTYTILGGRWSQITRAIDGHSADCTEIGIVNVSDPSEFPQVCYSKAIVLGGDTIDAEADATRCYLKRCGALKDLRFTASLGGRQSHTILTGGWSQLTMERDGVGIGCSYVGSYTPNVSEFPQSCFSQGVIMGANALDYRESIPRCYYKTCESFGEFAFTDTYGAYDTYTLLFPRGADGWGACDPATCLDLHLFYTANLRGNHLPVTSSGSACDPDSADACFGGIARRISYVEMKREELARTNESTVVLDLGGGTFGGPLWEHPDYPRGMPSTLLQNLMPNDFCSFSPRDFMTQDDNTSREHLVQALGNRTCQYILSNGEFKGPWSGFNSKLVPWTVKTMLNGWKVAFVSMFPHQANYGFGFGNSVLNLDKGGLVPLLFDGTSGVQLQLQMQTLKEQLEAVDYQYDQLEAHLSDVYVMATLTPSDVLRAAAQARRAHPDVRAVVLLVGGFDRRDAVDWLQRHGGFDVILKEQNVEPVLVPDISGKQSLLVGSTTLFGVAHVKVRLKAGDGVERFEFNGDVSLDSTIPSNTTAQTLMSQLFQVNRERMARPYGKIGNYLTGGHRGNEVPPSKNQCYYMECPAGRIIGDALLWKARAAGHQVDVSMYNLGGLRAPLQGDENMTVSIGHCEETLKFQNILKLYTILGRDLYNAVKTFIRAEERGILAAGFRAAFHEPCWNYVNHTYFEPADFWPVGDFPPGSLEEIDNCRASGVVDPNVVMIDVEVQHVDWAKCSSYTNCMATEWRTLEKGATYTIASTDFIMSSLPGFEPLGIELGSDALALCEYVGSQGVVQVESFHTYLQRGKVQYATAQDGWAAGLRVASVATPDSLLDDASTCPPGKHLPDNARACQDCPAGTSSEEVMVQGSLVPTCRQCTPGFYSDAAGFAACLPCAPGSFMSTAAATACQDCMPGFVSEAGAIRCTSCTPGSFANLNGSSVCSACPIGTFADGIQRSNCTSCPQSFVTRYPASTSQEDCICAAGSYLQHGEGCKACGEGLLCQGGNQEPLQASGYWVQTEGTSGTASRRYTIFKCRNMHECPQGSLGTCATNREDTACGSCRNNHYPTGNGDCVACDASSTIPSVVAAVLLPIGFSILVVCTKNDATTSHLTMITVASMAGQVVMAVQALVAMQHVQVDYPEPLSGLMEFLQVFSLDLTFLRLPCLLTSDSPRNMFVLKLLIYPFFVVLLLLLHRISRLVKRPLDSDTLFNINGWVLFILYISMALTVMMPFQCRNNPSGFLTMATNPGLKCFEDPEHQALAVLAVVGTIVYPVGTLAWAAYVTLTYKSKMLSAGGTRRLRRYRFLFGRFKLDVYFYGLIALVRNSLVALIPVVLVQLPAIQVLFMGAVLIVGIVTQVWLMPWRTLPANFSDTVLNTLLVLTVMGVATLLGEEVDGEDRARMVGIAAFSLVLTLFAMSVSLISWAVYRRLRPGNMFGMFLCHHKAGAGALCRLMKLIIQPYSSAEIFLDSDHLEDLDMLFDIVRSRVNNLVVVLTKSVLTRPWCAGEIVTSHRNSIPIVPLLCPDFDTLTAEDIDDIIEGWTEEEQNTLQSYDIDGNMVFAAFSYLMTLPRIEMPRFKSVLQKQSAIRELMSACKLSVRNVQNSRHSMEMRSTRVMITGAVGDAEGLAACEIVQVMLERKLEMELAIVFDEEGAAYHSDTAHILIILLSDGLLTNERFVKILLEIYQENKDEEVHFLTVNVNSGFKFPSADYYKQVEEQGLGLPGLGPEQGPRISAIFRSMLAILSKPFTPLGATGPIEVQINDLCGRVRRLLNVGGANAVGKTLSRTMTRAATDRSMDDGESRWGKKVNRDMSTARPVILDTV